MSDINVLKLKETTTPTATADYGKFYCKSDNIPYFQDGAGTEHPISDVTNASTELNVLSSTFNVSANRVLTGSIDPTLSRDVVGVGTLFTSEVNLGDTLVVSGEERTVVKINSDTSLSVHAAFSDNANDTSPEVKPFIFGTTNVSGDTVNFITGANANYITQAVINAARLVFNSLPGNDNFFIPCNITSIGSFRYFNDGYASQFEFNNGNYVFKTATSGTKDNVATLTTQFQISNDGSIITPNISVGTGNAVNIDATTGELYENTSSLQFKKDIATLNSMLSKTSQLRTVSFVDNEKTATEGEQEIGLIAEEVDLVAPELCVYKRHYPDFDTFKAQEAINNQNAKNEEDYKNTSLYDWLKLKKELGETPSYTQTPVGVKYDRLAVYNTRDIQELSNIIQTQATAINDLQSALTALTARVATLEGK